MLRAGSVGNPPGRWLLLTLLGVMVAGSPLMARTPELYLPAFADLRVQVSAWDPGRGHLVVEATVLATGAAVLSGRLGLQWPVGVTAVGPTEVTIDRIEPGRSLKRQFMARVGSATVGAYVDFAFEPVPDRGGLRRLVAARRELSAIERKILEQQIAGLTGGVPMGRSIPVSIDQRLAVALPAVLLPGSTTDGHWVWAPSARFAHPALAAAWQQWERDRDGTGAVAAATALVAAVASSPRTIELEVGQPPSAIVLMQPVVAELAAINLAVALARAGRLEPARDQLARDAARFDLAAPIALANLGAIRRRLGDRPGAAEAFRKALERWPAWPEVRSRLQEVAP